MPKLHFPWADLYFLEDHAFQEMAPELIEAELVTKLRGLIKPGMHVLDIGAHQGMYTTLFSTLVGEGKVHAIEPNPDNFYYLSRNVLNAGMNNVLRYNIALSDKAGIQQLKCFSKETGTHKLAPFKDPALDDPSYIYIPTQVMRLDDLDFRRLDFIKMDVEGEEVNVLNGATATITMFKPNMVIEIHSEENGRKVDAFASQFDYDVETFSKFKMLK